VTEILFAVEAGGRVVAIDDYSNFPEAAKALPKVGGVSVNYERVVGLEPDLVIGVSDLQGASLERLKTLGLDVLAIDTTSYDKTIEAVRLVAREVGEPGSGDRVAAALDEARAEHRAGYAGVPGASVLAVAEASPAVIAMGQGTFFDDLLRIVNAPNAAPVRGFAPLSREALATLRPDVVLTGSEEEAAAMRRRFEGLPGADPRVLVMPPDILVRPGPRLRDGLLWLAKATHPETDGGNGL